jgi:uroporphyrinogen-III decarboxylase
MADALSASMTYNGLEEAEMTQATSDRTMTSRERVLAAIAGKPVDRVPVMYWLNPHTTCRLMAEQQPGRSRIMNLLGRFLWKRFARGGEFDADPWTRAAPLLLEEYGNGPYALELDADIAVLSPEMISPSSFVRSVRKEDGRLRVRGPLGVGMALGGIYMDPVEAAVASAEDLEGLPLPAPSEDHFAAIRRFRRTHPNACLLVEVMSFQQLLCDYVLGTTAFMLALYDHPAALRAFMQRLADWIVETIRHAAAAGADIVYLQDDYGSNGRPLISMEMWLDLTYPHLARMADAAREAGVPFMLHSCGYQMPFLKYYVNSGVDALQSFQPKAGNDLASACERYGDRLAFATGIDIQRGEWMTPQELRADILRNYEIGRRHGRFILSMTHMMQYTMPPANVRAIFQTVREIQAGQHD